MVNMLYCYNKKVIPLSPSDGGLTAVTGVKVMIKIWIPNNGKELYL